MDATRAPLWFLGGWFVGTVLGGAALVAVHGDGDTTDATIGALAVSLIVLWGAELAACVLASRRDGTGDVVADLGLRFRPVDLVGVPLGVAGQLVLIPLVYAPLRAIPALNRSRSTGSCSAAQLGTLKLHQKATLPLK